MKYYPTMNVFDFDDTLLWARPWQDEANLNSDGLVINGGKSPVLVTALNFLQNLVKPMFLKLEQPNSKIDVFHFLLVDQNLKSIRPDDISKAISLSVLKQHRLKKKDDQLVITNDEIYYRQLDTVGNFGVNPNGANLYLKLADQAIVLTARKDFPGMNQKIMEALVKDLKPPQLVITRPITEPNPGKFKGEILLQIGSNPNVNLVKFYDDNPEYLEGAKKVIENSPIQHKFELHQVDASNKPSKWL